jgi:hypothetical protein
MISLLVTLLILVLVAGVAFWIISLLPIPAPWLNVAKAIVAIIVLIYLLSYLVPLSGHPLVR